LERACQSLAVLAPLEVDLYDFVSLFRSDKLVGDAQSHGTLQISRQLFFFSYSHCVCF
jgi:hypothetical protein